MMKILAEYFWNKNFYLNLSILFIIIIFLFLLKLIIVKNHVDIYEIKFSDKYFFVNYNLDFEKSFEYKLISNKNRNIFNKFKNFENRLDRNSCLIQPMITKIEELKKIFPFYTNHTNFSPSQMLDTNEIKIFNNIIYSHLHKPKQYIQNESLFFEIRNSFKTKNKFNYKVQMGIKKQLEIFNFTLKIKSHHTNNLLYKEYNVNNNKKNYLSIKFSNESHNIRENEFIVIKKRDMIDLDDYFIYITHDALFDLKDDLFYKFLYNYNIFDNNGNEFNNCLFLYKKLLTLFKNINLDKERPKFQIIYKSSLVDENKNHLLINIMISVFSILILLIFRIKN